MKNKRRYKMIFYLEYNCSYKNSWKDYKLKINEFRLPIRPQTNNKQKNLVNIEMLGLQTNHVFALYRRHMTSQMSSLHSSLLFRIIRSSNWMFLFSNFQLIVASIYDQFTIIYYDVTYKNIISEGNMQI